MFSVLQIRSKPPKRDEKERKRRSPSPRPTKVHVGRLTRNVTKVIMACSPAVKHSRSSVRMCELLFQSSLNPGYYRVAKVLLLDIVSLCPG